ncbi:hypothetical protein RchiOBHm_Chr7g0243411 [Rosa chinensis]|uniref:Uncharacterized protein n=1 Tax=Rosa chinensis TaxID=74649 RepID=A0A2P6PIS0_ROSCH|nr:hypothetical protein RchiOBHm_Chr7g0243411 [Rosa chinensis]
MNSSTQHLISPLLPLPVFSSMKVFMAAVSKVKITYQGEYGCSCMGFTTTILQCYGPLLFDSVLLQWPRLFHGWCYTGGDEVGASRCGIRLSIPCLRSTLWGFLTTELLGGFGQLGAATCGFCQLRAFLFFKCYL